MYSRDSPFIIKSNRFLHLKIRAARRVDHSLTVCVFTVSEMMTQPYLCVCACVTAATISLHTITTNPHSGNRWAMTGSLGLMYLIVFTLQSSCISRTLEMTNRRYSNSIRNLVMHVVLCVNPCVLMFPHRNRVSATGLNLHCHQIEEKNKNKLKWEIDVSDSCGLFRGADLLLFVLLLRVFCNETRAEIMCAVGEGEMLKCVCVKKEKVRCWSVCGVTEGVIKVKPWRGWNWTTVKLSNYLKEIVNPKIKIDFISLIDHLCLST